MPTWLSLDAAKEHLGIPLNDDRDNKELETFIADVVDALQPRIGVVELTTDPIVRYGRGGQDRTRIEGSDALPIGEIVSISVNGATVPEANRDTGAPGWYLEDGDAVRRAGVIHHTGTFPTGFVKVTLRPGRDPVPHDITLGGLELLRHLWKTQRGVGNSRPGLYGEQLDPPAAGPNGGDRPLIGFTFPNRVMELIGPHRLPEAA